MLSLKNQIFLELGEVRKRSLGSRADTGPGSKSSFLVCVAMPGSHLGLVLPYRSRTLLQVPTLHSSSGSAGLLLNTGSIAVLAAPRVKRRRLSGLGSIGHAWGHEFESQYPW